MAQTEIKKCKCKWLRTYKGNIRVFLEGHDGIWAIHYGPRPSPLAPPPTTQNPGAQERFPPAGPASLPPVPIIGYMYPTRVAGDIEWGVTIKDCFGCTSKDVDLPGTVNLSMGGEWFDFRSDDEETGCGEAPPATPHPREQVPGSVVWSIGTPLTDEQILELRGFQWRYPCWLASLSRVVFVQAPLPVYPPPPVIDPQGWPSHLEVPLLWHVQLNSEHWNGPPPNWNPDPTLAGLNENAQSPVILPDANRESWVPNWVPWYPDIDIFEDPDVRIRQGNSKVMDIEFTIQDAHECRECKKVKGGTTPALGEPGTPPGPTPDIGVEHDPAFDPPPLEVSCEKDLVRQGKPQPKDAAGKIQPYKDSDWGLACKDCSQGGYGSTYLTPSRDGHVVLLDRAIPPWVNVMIKNREQLSETNIQWLIRQGVDVASMSPSELWTEYMTLEGLIHHGNPQRAIIESMRRSLLNLGVGCNFKKDKMSQRLGPLGFFDIDSLEWAGGYTGIPCDARNRINPQSQPQQTDRSIENFCDKVSKGFKYDNL